MAIANQIVEAYSGKIRITFEVAIALHSSVTLKAKTYFRVDYAAIEGLGGMRFQRNITVTNSLLILTIKQNLEFCFLILPSSLLISLWLLLTIAQKKFIFCWWKMIKKIALPSLEL